VTAAPLNKEQVRETLAKVEKLRSPDRWDVDWDSLCIVLVSDGSGEFAAEAATPIVAEGIVAAVRVVAQLAAEWEARSEALKQIADGEVFGTIWIQEFARAALGVAPTTPTRPAPTDSPFTAPELQEIGKSLKKEKKWRRG
jgi:hypothetical protein